MCSHLDAVIPDTDEKVHLHQDFWRHRRTCGRCSGRNSETSYVYNNTVCPLEHLITRRAPETAATRKRKNAPDSDAASTDTKPSPAKKQKIQTTPPKKPVKKLPTADEQIAKGMVSVTYEVDDDFDAAGRSTGVTRTVWIQDFSKLEEDVVMAGMGTIIVQAKSDVDMDTTINDATAVVDDAKMEIDMEISVDATTTTVEMI